MLIEIQEFPLVYIVSLRERRGVLLAPVASAFTIFSLHESAKNLVLLQGDALVGVARKKRKKKKLKNVFMGYYIPP
jgi:hypothetical protein